MQKLFIPQFAEAASEIVAVAESQIASFVAWPTHVGLARRKAAGSGFHPEKHSGYECDRCRVLERPRMNTQLESLISTVFAQIGYDIRGRSLQLRRYGLGDYALPHLDYTPQAVFILTDSPVSGLVVQDTQGRFVKIPDERGACILPDRSAWHWVDPVTDPVRYTLVVVPNIITGGLRGAAVNKPSPKS